MTRMSSLENFTICWNDFDSHLRSSMKNLRSDSSFCDVSLICEDFQVKAHKVILASSSLTFSQILRSNPHPHPLIYLNSVEMKDIIYLLNYMYSGQIEVASEDIVAVLKIFRGFQVKGFDHDAFISDNSLASSIDQGVQFYPTSWINQHVLDISIKTEDDNDDADSVDTQSYTNQPILTRSEDSVGSTGSENLANCSIHTDATHPSAMPTTINQNIHTDDVSPPSTINQAIHGFHIDATSPFPSTTTSSINQAIRTDATPPSTKTSSINQAIHTDNTPPATTPSSINKASLPVPGCDEQVKCGRLNSNRNLRSSSLSLQPENVKLSSEQSCAENSRNQEASSTSNLPCPSSPIFTKKKKSVKNNQQILESPEDNVGSTGSESLENDCSIRKDATPPSATPSIINKIHDEQVKCGSLNSARHLRSSSLSLQSENVKLSSKPSCAENSLKKDAISTSTLPCPSSSIFTKKNKLNSVIIKAIENIKSKKKGPNLGRITEVMRKLQPNKESISSKDVLKHLDEAVQQGVVQRTRKLGKVTYKII